MCVGSVLALRQEEARPDVEYRVGCTNHYGFLHGVLFKEGDGYVDHNKVDVGRMIACAACVQEPTYVVLTNIPRDLQKQFQLKECEERVLFVPEKERKGGIQQPDLLQFNNSGCSLPLRLFADYPHLRLKIPVPQEDAEVTVTVTQTRKATHQLEHV